MHDSRFLIVEDVSERYCGKISVGTLRRGFPDDMLQNVGDGDDRFSPRW
jgi:hypothetical protein